MAVTAADLEAKVDALGLVVTDVATRLGVLAQEVRDAASGMDQAALQRIADKIDAEQVALQSARDATSDVP